MGGVRHPASRDARHGSAAAEEGRRLPRRCGVAGLGSVDPADEPADVAGGDPGEGIELEEARAPVGAAEELWN